MEGHREPENCFYLRTKDGFDLWTVLFPDFDREPGHLKVSDEWRIRIGCDSKDLVSFRFGEDLAHGLAKYATMIDFWLKQIDSTRKTELNITIVEEKLFQELFHDSYIKGLNGRSEMDGEPIVLSWRDLGDKPHIKLGVNIEILSHSRMKRLFYALGGILECIGGLKGPEAVENASRLIQTLE